MKEVRALPPSSGEGVATEKATRDARTTKQAKKRMFEFRWFSRIRYGVRSQIEEADVLV